MRILVDADACPVKEQIYRVAARYALPVWSWPTHRCGSQTRPTLSSCMSRAGLTLSTIGSRRGDRADIVTTADILLAGRVVDKGAVCIDFRGKEFTPDALGGLLARREVAQYLRGYGAYGGGPPPLNPRDRGRFAGKLDEVVNRQLRAARRAGPS